MTRQREYIWRRGAERVSLSLPVRWGADESCIHRGLLTSLSATGALIETRVASLPHERLYLRLPDGAGNELQVAGEVAYYVKGRGVAVQFTGAAAEREAVARLVEHYRANATGG